MRIIHLVAAAIVGLAAAGGLTQGQGELPRRAGAVSAETTGAIRPESYGIVVNGSVQDCVLTPGRRLDEASRQLELSARCDLAWLSPARVWVERANGDVALAAADGRTLVELGASDGAAFESFRPAVPMVTLTALP